MTNGDFETGSLSPFGINTGDSGVRGVFTEYSPTYATDNDIAYVNIHGAGSTENFFDQSLTIGTDADHLQAGQSYTLKADVGVPNYSGNDPGHVNVYIWVDSGPMGNPQAYDPFAGYQPHALGDITVGTFSTITYDFTVPAGFTGPARLILLTQPQDGYNPTAGYTQVNFDNVAIVPEPGMLSFVIFTSVGFFAFKSKRL